MKIRNLLLILLFGFSLNGFSQFDCGCPTIFEPVCVQDSSGFYFEVPNACLAQCWGLTITTDTTLCDNTNPWDCDCPQEVIPVCVQDDFGHHFQLPNACLAECLGFDIVNDSLCIEIFNPFDCECDQVYNPVCVQDSSGFYFEVPNACYAECWGFTIVNDSTLCEFVDPWACDCPGEYDPVCVQDSVGNYFEAPNACFAECWGMTVVTDTAACNLGGFWNDCNCTYDENEPFICAIDSAGFTTLVPNACYAECWGLTVLNSDTLCNGLVIDTGVDTFEISCIDSINFENTTFQQALLLINSVCGIELPECILNAPIFATDEDFLAYIVDNCEDLGFNGTETGGSSVLNLYNTLTEGRITKTKEVIEKEVKMELLSNPTSQNLNFNIISKKSAQANLSLIDMNGRKVQAETIYISEGLNKYTRNVSTLSNGVYYLNISAGSINTTTKVVIIQ